MLFYRPIVHGRNLSRLSAIQFSGMRALSAAAVAATHGVGHVTDTASLLLPLLLQNICAPGPQRRRLALAASLGCAGPSAMSFMPATRVHHASPRGASLSSDKAACCWCGKCQLGCSAL